MSYFHRADFQERMGASTRGIVTLVFKVMYFNGFSYSPYQHLVKVETSCLPFIDIKIYFSIQHQHEIYKRNAVLNAISASFRFSTASKISLY